MGNISNYTQVSASKLADKLVCDQEDSGVTSTKSVSIEQIGNAVNALQVRSDLDTQAQTIVSAINELTTYIPVWNNTASGAIATFDTSLALPLQDCTIEINGTNLTGANIHNGINLYNPANTTPGKYINDRGEPANSSYSKITDYIEYSEPTLIIKSEYVTLGSVNPRNFGCYDANKDFIAVRVVDYANKLAIISIPANTAYIRATIDMNITDLFIGSTSVTPINWQTEAGTVSEGTLDVTTGKLTIVNGSMGAGDYQITPIPINQLSGANNIFCDTGNTSVVYACSLKDYIDGQ